jgi:hypothetical protein
VSGIHRGLIGVMFSRGNLGHSPPA